MSAPAPAPASAPLLSIEGLRTYFHVPATGRFVRAADGVDLQVFEGETLVIVGESGSGKSVSMLSALGLISATPGVVSGRVWYRSPGTSRAVDLLEGLDRFVRLSPGPPARIAKNDRGWRRFSEKRMGPLRGRDLAMIFQNPRSALHPYFTVGQQLCESIRRAQPELGARQARELAVQWLERVRIDDPKRRMDDHPHGLSGGMCQRVMIAMALAVRPALLIADEPTTGLDATVQSRVLDLMEEMKESLGTTTIVVTHDIGVARRLADRVAVMYAGRVLEAGPAQSVLDTSCDRKHPYTTGLLRSVPSAEEIRSRSRLRVIEGEVPDLSSLPRGCAFADRCARRPEASAEHCDEEQPELEAIEPDHRVRCWLYVKKSGSGS